MAQWIGAFVGFLTLNAVTIQFILKRHDEEHFREAARAGSLEKIIYELKASLPLDYVRREDWIRFSGTLDAKLDTMREEMRVEIAEIKEKLYVGRN